MGVLLALTDSLGSTLPGAAAKMLVAFVLGGLLGLERESRRKPVGFKTCVIIAVTSCVLTDVSIQSAEYYAEISANIRSDPMRLAAQVISGMGFLGAGVILHRRDDVISGLTTAAIIWASAGVGIACGATFYLHATLFTLLLLAVVKLSPLVILLQARRPPAQPGKVRVQMIADDRAVLLPLMGKLNEQPSLVEAVRIRDLKHNNIEIVLQLILRKGTTAAELYPLFCGIDHVCRVRLEY